MYLHIGSSVIIPVLDILGIFDLSLNKSSSTKEFLQSIEGKHIVMTTDIEDCKSFIITDDKLYFSPISPGTLKKRVELLC